MGVDNNPDSSLLSDEAEASAHIQREQRLALLKQVLSSRTFSKSTRLSHFLEFVCLREIEGRTQEINEQQIGIHVFGRSPAYNPSDDSIVRTQARLLRQRLEEYFEHECPTSPSRMTMPKGGYVPHFELLSGLKRRAEYDTVLLTTTNASDAPKALIPVDDKMASMFLSRRPLFVGLVSLLLLLAVAGYWRYRSFANAREAYASGLMWKSIFGAGRPVVVVPSDDALVLFEEFNKATVPLEDYLSGSYLQKTVPSAPAGLNSGWFISHQYTSTADLNLAMRLGRVPAARNAEVETRNAHVLRVDDMKSRNVILIGGLAANPWVSLFAEQLSFEVNYDWNASQGFVRNKHPAPGEASLYRETIIDGSKHSYGVLAYLPGISGDGEALLFEGTGMAGTEAAADFPFNALAFQAFARRIGSVNGKLPYFEALLETTSVGGNGPEARVITYHLIRP